MSITQEADIPEWVLPYYNKGMEKTVINMHKEGLSPDTIQKVTGLSKKKIQAII